jgi:hypothetical protein
MTRQRYRIQWYRGYIHPDRLVNINEDNGRPVKYHTTVHAFSMEQAVEFAKMRRPGLITEVTLIPKEKT